MSKIENKTKPKKPNTEQKEKKNLEALDLKIFYKVILTVNSTWYWHQNNTKCTQCWSMANTEIPEINQHFQSQINGKWVLARKPEGKRWSFLLIVLVKLNFYTEKNKIRVPFFRVHIHTYTYVRAYPRPNIRESCEAAKINHGESSVIQFKLINFFPQKQR